MDIKTTYVVTVCSKQLVGEDRIVDVSTPIGVCHYKATEEELQEFYAQYLFLMGSTEEEIAYQLERNEVVSLEVLLFQRENDNQTQEVRPTT